MSKLTYMEKLLEGVEVEWKPLADIADIYGGLTGKSKADFESGNAKYISYKNIFNNIDLDPGQLELVKVSENERQHKVRYGDILFTGSSEIAVEAGMSSAVTSDFTEPVYLNSFSFGVRFNDDVKLMPEFSKYLFRSRFMRADIAKSASGVTRFNVSKARFKKILVPIPCPDKPEKSLAIQAEIVRILDAFTAMTAELTAELNMRKKQYNYYRDQLLSFEEGEVEWKTLGDENFFEVGSGGTPSKSKPEYWDDGNIPWLKSESCNNEPVYFANNFITELGLSKSSAKLLQKKTTLIALVGATIFKTAFLEFPAATNQNIASIKSKKPEAVSDKFVFYYITNLYEVLKSEMRNYGMLNLTTLRQFRIPIPHPEEQARIVAILDKFDALTNSITEGLPREIELRQKQYEYYRDLLLSFPKPEEAAA